MSHRTTAKVLVAGLVLSFSGTSALRAQAVPAASHGSGVATTGDSDAPDPVRRGWSASIVSSAAHDSSSGWSILETPALGVRFNRLLSADAALPYYAYVNAISTQGKGRKTTTSPTVQHGVLGDAAVAAHLTFEPDWLSYTATTAVTVPTGDQHLGLGSGHFGYNLNNHVERSMGAFTPDFEAGVGNTSSLFRRRIQKSYTSSGLLGFLQAGTAVDLPYKTGLDVESYEQVPLGAQTVYSRAKRKHGNVLSEASDAEDNGVSAEFDAPPVRRLSLAASYSHSIRLNDTTVGLSLALLLHAPSGR